MEREKRIEQIVEKAQLAFWDEVVRYFPADSSGDFPPDATFELDAALEKAVALWIDLNVFRAYAPSGFGPTHHIEQGFVDQLTALGLVDTSWGNDTAPSFAYYPDGDDEAEGFRLYIDAFKAEDREDPELERFGFTVPDGDNTDYGTNDFAMIVASVKEALMPTIDTLREMAKAARPVSDSEWGSDRQITAENKFCAALERYLKPAGWEHFEDYALKATTEEMLDCGLMLAARAAPDHGEKS
jgi:hypothetical protein